MIAWLLVAAALAGDLPTDPPAPVPATADQRAPAPAADAGCTATLEDFRGTVRAFKDAWTAMLPDDAKGNAGRLREQVGCLKEPLTTLDVGVYFAVQALAASLDGLDSDETEQNMHAFSELQPAYRLADFGINEAHPLRDVFVAVSKRPPESPSLLAPPVTGHLLVDGRQATKAPGGRRYVVQWVGADGVVLSTQEVAPFGTPSYETAPPEAVGPVAVTPPMVLPEPLPAEPPPRTSRALLGSGIAAGIAAGACLGTATALYTQYWDPQNAELPMTKTVTANRVLWGSGVGLAVAGGALGLGAVVVHRW